MPFLPVYKLGPFRILVTFIGVALAFIFTIFPFPVTSRDLLRQDVAQQFHLLSKMYSQTQARLNTAGCSNNAAIQRLTRSMGKVSLKCIAVQGRSSDNLMYASWEPNFRYRFPHDIYSELLSSLQRYIVSHLEHDLTIVSMTCTSFKTMPSHDWKESGYKP